MAKKMMSDNWWKPAALAAAVIAGVAYVRSQTPLQKAGGVEKLKIGDEVSVNGSRLLLGNKDLPPLPVKPPEEARLLLKLNNVTDGLIGDVVGWVDPVTNKPMRPFGGAGGIGPAAVERTWILDVYPAAAG